MSPPAVCLLSVLLAVTSPWWHRACLADEASVDPKCTVENTITKCVCGGTASGSVSQGAATLSASTNTITVTCSEGSTFVPSNPLKVCARGNNAPSLAECEPVGKGTDAGTAPITDFLSTSPAPTNDIKWASTDNNNVHSLTILPPYFPSTDKSFFVGCRKQSDGQGSCLFNVSVKARKTVLNGNVLTCAYGKESNAPVPQVTLDPTSNSLTVDCGEDGTMPLTGELPTVYYCKDSATDACDPVKDVTEILPGFAKEWWTPVNGLETAAKLTVPEGGFPVEPKTIVLGCNLSSASSPSDKGESRSDTAATALPTCRAKVILSAAASASFSIKVSIGVSASVFAVFAVSMTS
ncbi:SAG-related sequence [Besnoitia besnoiti]|uniref:SAG-related sequence n=1 Tax=Besnoitia besnoiti TaxID=94643 RepID=A0A2A9MBK2_BESBE|nr:SAG-related sequence [Besnoitia besnoiti]PFH35259.1 SAG-related sequence [Besnoitia besnoiti]